MSSTGAVAPSFSTRAFALSPSALRLSGSGGLSLINHRRPQIVSVERLAFVVRPRAVAEHPDPALTVALTVAAIHERDRLIGRFSTHRTALKAKSRHRRRAEYQTRR